MCVCVRGLVDQLIRLHFGGTFEEKKKSQKLGSSHTCRNAAQGAKRPIRSEISMLSFSITGKGDGMPCAQHWFGTAPRWHCTIAFVVSPWNLG